MADKHETLPAKEFQAELENPETLELTACRVLSDSDQGFAILYVQGRQATRHQGFQPRTHGALQVSASVHDLLKVLRDCILQLQDSPEDRIADSLERIEKHLARIVP